MTFPANVSKNDLAQLLGMTPRRIGQLTDDKVLTRNSHGTYATAPSIAAYIAFKERAAADRLDGGADYNSARARKMEADARLSEMELAARAGTVVNFEHTLQEVTRLTSAIKTRYLALPTRMAPRCANKSVSEVHELLRAQVHKDLHSVSELVANAAAEIRGGEHAQPENDAAAEAHRAD
jgi:phage terminase Nu1 subunit (DNA packaging protein)